MNVMKCEPDPDGESFVTSCDSESQLNDKDRVVMELPVTDSENECLQLNVDTIKVEHETHLLQHAVETVETLNEGDVTDNSSHLSLSPVCPLIKCETEVITDLIKSEPDSYCETCASPSHIENEMTGAKEEEDPLLLRFPLMQNENEVLNMNPSNDGERFNWSRLNPQSEHQLKSDYASPVQLSECQNHLLLRRARNAERKRRSRQTRKAKETLEEAAVRRAQHADQVRRWRRSRLASETPQVAATRRAQHAEVMRQWRISQRANETPEEAASRRAQQTAQVLIMSPGNGGEKLNRSQLNLQSGYQQRRDITSPVQHSKYHIQDSLKRARNAERMRRWRQARQASETLQEAASRRAQHADEVRKWRRSRGTNETPQVPSSRRAHQTAQVLIVNAGNNEERRSRSQLSAQSESQEKRDDAAPFLLSRSRNDDSLSRARNADRKRRWRLLRQAVETPEEAATRRAHHAEEVRLWRQSRVSERCEGPALRWVQQTAAFHRARTAHRPFVSGNRIIADKQMVVYNETL